MKQRHLKTTIFAWITAVGLAVSSPKSPLTSLVSTQVQELGAIVAMIGVGMTGQAAADKKKED